jgi:hypothetical protein
MQQRLAGHIAAIERMDGFRERLADSLSADRTRDGRTAATSVSAGLSSPPGLQIQDELGRGGMGVVFRAEQERLGRTVALKMLLAAHAPERAEVTRFLAEAAAMAAVRHPNVVQVFDCGEHDGRPYLTMELLTGGTLKERVAVGPMAATAAAELVERLARGVHAAHAAGIVHRDLKPGNVLFDADGTPKVSDFGLAKRGEVDQTQTNALIGTPAYMSPEQARGEGKFAGPPADVWALGVILYECLTGRRPFAGRTPLEVMGRIADAAPERPTRFAAVPRDLERVCLKCLAKEPADRYRTAAALADDLRAFGDGRPVSARPVPAVVKGWKWAKRNPVPTGLVVAVLFALAATAGLFWQSAAAAQARADQATADTQKAEAELAAQRDREQAQAKRIQDGHLARAKLAGQRGAAREAVAAYDDAVAAGATLTDEQKVDRLTRLFDITAPNRRAELTAVDPGNLSPALRGRWHLLNGFDLVGKDEGGATAELNRAIELLPADSWGVPFARAVLEPDTEKALALLDTAIERNPTALDPRHMQMFILFMHGRYAELLDKAREVRPLAPDDPQTALLSFMARSARKEKVEAKRLAGVLRKEFPKDVIDVLEVIGPVFFGLTVEGGLNEFILNRDFLMFLALGGIPKVQSSMALLSGGDTTTEVVFRRAPRCLQPLTRLLGYSFRNLFGALDPKNPLKVLNLTQIVSLLTPEQFEELKGYAATSPEGFVRWWYAGELMIRNKYVQGAGFGTRDRKLLAAEAVPVGEQYEAAYRAKGFLFDARRMSLEGAVMMYAIAAMGINGSDPDDTDPAVARRGAALLREWLTDPRVNDSPHRYLPLGVQVRLALVAGDRGLAQTLLDNAERRDPHDGGLPLARAYLFHHLGNWEGARLNAMILLEGNPEHPHLLRIFRQSTDKLQQLGKAGY